MARPLRRPRLRVSDGHSGLDRLWRLNRYAHAEERRFLLALAGRNRLGSGQHRTLRVGSVVSANFLAPDGRFLNDSGGGGVITTDSVSFGQA